MTSSPARLRALVPILVLVAGLAAIYAQVRGHGFVDYDDDTYVTANEVVGRGLHAEGLRWAFTTGHGSNWHPLTWLSHMLDVTLFGLEPAGHHLMNVLLHALVAVLFFLWVRRVTDDARIAFVAAAFFAWHPLRVESVAWVAERKDVLSGVFFVACLLAYERWTRERSLARYVLLVVLFALGLATKPMLVTLPFLLLVLDRWPLARWDLGPARLFTEKLPLLALSVASSVATLSAQEAGGAVVSATNLPLALRVENALRSTAVYLGQTLWPRDLCVFYPHARATEEDPTRALFLPALGATLLLVVLAVAAWRARRRFPAGWTSLLWFGGLLVPVLGLVLLITAYFGFGGVRRAFFEMVAG